MSLPDRSRMKPIHPSMIPSIRPPPLFKNIGKPIPYRRKPVLNNGIIPMFDIEEFVKTPLLPTAEVPESPPALILDLDDLPPTPVIDMIDDELPSYQEPAQDYVVIELDDHQRLPDYMEYSRLDYYPSFDPDGKLVYIEL